jgi:uncharacterized membrane protein YhaH (DUF805 family)
MSIATILFSPNGRIGPGNFWRGYIIILAVSLVIQVINVLMGPSPLAVPLGLASLVLYWCTIAIFAKRLHDTGATGWWIVAIAAGWTLIMLVGVAIILGIFAGDVMSTAMQDETYAQSPQFMLELQDAIFVPGTALGLVINIALGFIMANLRSEPNSNAYGPPTGGSPGDTFS